MGQRRSLAYPWVRAQVVCHVATAFPVMPGEATVTQGLGLPSCVVLSCASVSAVSAAWGLEYAGGSAVCWVPGLGCCAVNRSGTSGTGRIREAILSS